MCLLGFGGCRLQNLEPKRYLTLITAIFIMADRSKTFFTETASMRTLTFPSSSQTDWGFRVGLGLIALFAAAEIGSVGYYYAARASSGRSATQPEVAAVAPGPARTLPTVAPSVAVAPAPS